ncbi:MAG: DUF1998 domain-containing protein [Deltaproteobacteria bacterium]|nr:DUF1998 domain-containing protein [Deltaproteobacteria bacterium]
MTRKAIGDVRPSQVITTFGPGAIVDLQTMSVIVAGIDGWQTGEENEIHEIRLEQTLGVERFFSAAPSEGGMFGKKGTIPSYLFPRYQVCPVCRTLSEPSEGWIEYMSKWQELVCKAPNCEGKGKHRATTIPAPFIIACPGGHIDDFPWRRYVHRGETSCKQRMSLYSTAKTGSVSDITIKCACGKVRSASEAFGEKRGEALGKCTRNRPWLGKNAHDPVACIHSDKLRAMQRGATNAWFPVVKSALKINNAASPIGLALTQCDIKKFDRINTLEDLQTALGLGLLRNLERYEPVDIWNTLQKIKGEIAFEEIDLRWPEWSCFREPVSASDDNSEFYLEKGKVPAEYSFTIADVILARRLLEVRALTGFTRIDANGAGTMDGIGADIAPISLNAQSWLPAVEVRGEGIFIELNEAAVASWEALPKVQERAQRMKEKFVQWDSERNPGRPSPFPGARYVLLHTLAHAIMRQLSLDCGYSASSVRERIYSSTATDRKMAGILLYTASPDSEGSLGGLVDLGSAERFPELLTSALVAITRCSSDPLCADHQPDVHATINGAACHACILAPETSCESFNRFLDRSMLIPTMASADLAFFRGNDE